MNFKEMIDGYFNSGSTDKRNKRRLGALLIGVTAILLVVSIFVTAIGGAIMAAVGIFDLFKGDNEGDGEPTGNTHLIECAVEDFKTKPVNTIVFDSSVPTFTTTTLARTNRPYVQNGENKSYLYGCQSAEGFGLQTEAHTAFNAMVQAFYDENQLKLFVKEAYNVGEGAANTAYFVNALAVRLNAASDDLGDLGSIYEYGNTESGVNEKYEWIYENAYKFGFVQVTNSKGDENVFRYVGLAHARYISEKQEKSKDVFYTIDAFLEEVKATTPDTKMTLTGIKSLTDDDTMKYYVYFMATAEGAVYKIPNAKHDYVVMAVDGGYIVTYWKLAK